jgi:putative transposase
MRFTFIDAKKAEFPINRMCKVLGVSPSGFHAWKDRPACQRQRQDMVLLAHVRSAFKLSNGTYGSPRMTRELQDEGHAVGRRLPKSTPGQDGLYVARQSWTEGAVAFCSTESALKALDAGATGFVLKGSPSGEFLEAIETVATGQMFVTRQYASQVMNGLRDRSRRQAL